MGESACWIDQVCMTCGRVEPDLDGDQHCRRCRPRTDDRRSTASEELPEADTSSAPLL